MKMTVKEAFEKYNEILINYVFEAKCRECGKWYDEIDEEYSFEGDKEYFLGDWQREYGVIDLDDEIEQLEGEECKFNLYRNAANEDLCPTCRLDDE